MFAAAVAEQTDVRALFALPLQLGTIKLGALDLYRTTPGPLPGNELRDVITAVDIAVLLLLTVPGHASAAHTNGTASNGQHTDRQWGGMWTNRAEVHQATGMILAQLEVPAHEAFVRLRAHAFATRRSLADVARDVVARRLGFTPDMD